MKPIGTIALGVLPLAALFGLSIYQRSTTQEHRAGAAPVGETNTAKLAAPDPQSVKTNDTDSDLAGVTVTVNGVKKDLTHPDYTDTGRVVADGKEKAGGKLLKAWMQCNSDVGSPELCGGLPSLGCYTTGNTIRLCFQSDEFDDVQALRRNEAAVECVVTDLAFGVVQCLFVMWRDTLNDPDFTPAARKHRKKHNALRASGGIPVD